MRTIPVPARRHARPELPKRVLALAADERLVEQIRRGNETAFEVAFERHSGQVLSFCRHMLGTREEAEDAVQHTFAAAYRTLLDGERDIALKPWLYAIARNRCLSMLRARREEASEDVEPETAGLQEQVQRRAELRDVLRDLRDLPAEQREALLLSELGGLSHADVADVLECEVPRVKALVFRARSGLMQRRQGREMPCREVREQLANLRGGSLRRSELRHHLRTCEGCREYREEVRRQRQLVAAVLPVIPTAGLKSAVLGAVGIGGGSAGGAAAAGGVAAAGGWVGAPGLAKLAAAGVLVGGGALGGTAALDGGSATPQKGGPAGAPAVAGAVDGAAGGRADRGMSRERAKTRPGGAGAGREAAGNRRGSSGRGPSSAPPGAGAPGIAEPLRRKGNRGPARPGKPKRPKKVKTKGHRPQGPPARRPPKPPPAAAPTAPEESQPKKEKPKPKPKPDVGKKGLDEDDLDGSPPSDD